MYVFVSVTLHAAMRRWSTAQIPISCKRIAAGLYVFVKCIYRYRRNAVYYIGKASISIPMIELSKYPSGNIITNLRAARGSDEEGHFLNWVLKTSRDGLLTTFERSLFQSRTVETKKVFW